ncbi:hypothetical protein EV385_6297 [Krasilnikovia cinnamomea]|uniref:Uncharacterized protein n=1 Tax=Krasilnikovia cinnamomea TaxID=349313 RepID=A0A4V6MG79_9ACTN|nr:hypothetical protein [Krasilnikovia cinnamomea]RZU54346.1 hypothetical protein EV385_6297 [Krasilnikovia cinnamomea]
MQTTTEVRYDLDTAEVRRRVTAYLAAHPGQTSRFISAVVANDHPLANVGRTVERLIFEEAFGNDTAVMLAEYGPYEDRSLFFVIIDCKDGVPAGAGRIVEGTGIGLKTVDDAPAHIGVPAEAILATHGMTGEKAWDYTTVAVLPQYRGGQSQLMVSSLIHRTFLVAGARAQVRHVVTMLDRRAYRNMAMLGINLQPLAGSGPFEYLGSAENRAVYCSFPELAGDIAARGERLLGVRPIGDDHGARELLEHPARLISARACELVGTGKGLDEHIILPA